MSWRGNERFLGRRTTTYLRIVASLPACLAGGVDPLVFVGGARAGPRGGVELLVSDVVASVAGVWFDGSTPERQGGRTTREGW